MIMLCHDNACIRSNIIITYCFMCNMFNITCITWPNHYFRIHPRMFTKYPVNTNVTIDERGKGTNIGPKKCLISLSSITCWDNFLTAITRLSFVYHHVIKRIWHSLSFHKVLLNSFNKTLYEMTTHVRSYIYKYDHVYII